MEKIDKDLYKDIMIDIETLGNEGKFVVTQIALVPFTMNNAVNINDALIVNISVESSLKKGFEINPNTLIWWINENSKMLEGQLRGGIGVKTSCERITEYLKKHKNVERFWATATLDYVGISNIFKSSNLKNPITYNKRYCARTIRLLAESKGFTRILTNDHNALNDCVNQIEILKEQLIFINCNL